MRAIGMEPRDLTAVADCVSRVDEDARHDMLEGEAQAAHLSRPGGMVCCTAPSCMSVHWQ